MPTLELPASACNLPRNAALLDTNVLVAYFDDTDENHGLALLTLDEDVGYVWLVSTPVVVEACGLLGRRRSQRQVLSLLVRLFTDENVLIFPQIDAIGTPISSIEVHTNWMRQHSVDYVDSHLMNLAHFFSTKFMLRPNLPIATLDMRDFLRCGGKGLRYNLLNIEELELIDFH